MMDGGEAMEGGGQQWERERWMEGGWMDLTHLGSLSPVSIHGCWLSFVGGHLHSWVGVVSWALVICAWGSLSSVLSFMVAVAVLGAGLSFVGAVSSFMGGAACSRVVCIIHGWGVDVCGLWLLYMCGVGAVMGH